MFTSAFVNTQVQGKYDEMTHSNRVKSNEKAFFLMCTASIKFPMKSRIKLSVDALTFAFL